MTDDLRTLLLERDRWRAAGNEALAEWYDQCARLAEHGEPPREHHEHPQQQLPLEDVPHA